MMPAAEAATAAAGAGAAVPASVPLRMAFLYSPNGMHMADWTPADTGSAFKLPATLEPLKALRGEFSVLTGLAHQKANANGDGGGDHARAMTTFLTGVQARKTSGADIHAGVSVDQLAARQLGKRTRLPSLEIGADGGGRSGSCDSGYSCAYSSTISWRSETQPVPKETDPELIFERLFESGLPHETEAARARRALRRRAPPRAPGRASCSVSASRCAAASSSSRPPPSRAGRRPNGWPRRLRSLRASACGC
jgi:hypothetical protein